MNYCDACLKRHNKNPLFKTHQVLDKSEDTVSDFYCKMHPGEPGKYFCRTCEVVCCTVCVNAHEDHNITEIDKVFRQHQQEILNLKNVVDSKISGLKKKATMLEDLRQVNLSSYNQAEIAIKDHTKNMLDLICKEENCMLGKLLHKRDAKLKILKQEMNRVNFHLQKADGVQSFASDTISGKNLRLMAVHEELIQRMRTVAEADANAPSGEIQAIVTFLPGRVEPNIGRVEEVKGSAEELNRHGLILSPDNARPALSRGNTERSGKPRLLVNINKYGTKPGELKDPLGVACLLSGDIVITEWGNKRVQIFDSVGQHVTVLGGGNLGPQGVAITLKGNIIITDGVNKRLEVFTPSGHSLAKWGLGKFFGPCGLVISPNGNCVVSDVDDCSVSIFKGERTCLKRFGSRGPADLNFDNPLYVSCGQHNEIIVSDSNNHHIKIFDSVGRLIRKFGGEGTSDGHLRFPRGVCTDSEGNIVVCDRNNDRVSLFSPHGRFIRHLLTRDDGVKDPYAVSISITGNLVITESAKDRAAIKMFEM